MRVPPVVARSFDLNRQPLRLIHSQKISIGRHLRSIQADGMPALSDKLKLNFELTEEPRSNIRFNLLGHWRFPLLIAL